MWSDTRNDTCYSPARPVGNCADKTLVPSLDVYGSTLDPTTLAAAAPPTKITDVTSNPNWDQFAGRTVPFAGDYLWVDSAAGVTFSTWTDYRNTVAGNDPRTTSTRGDVHQCRTERADGTFTGDTCPSTAAWTRTSTATCRPESSRRRGGSRSRRHPLALLAFSLHRVSSRPMKVLAIRHHSSRRR